MKQIFPLKSIPCVYDMIIWKKSSQNLVSMLHLCNCFYLLQFLSILTIYVVAYCHMHLWITDQSWQTGPNEFVLLFEAVFVDCWHQIGKLEQIVSCTVALFWSNYANFCHRFVFWRYWNKSSNWEKYHVCVYMIIWRDCLQTIILTLDLCVCLDLLLFVSH